MSGFLLRPMHRFFRQTIWREDPRDPAPVRAFLRLMQLGYLVVQHFQDDRGFLRSSALAYTTLLSLVPLLAFVFSVLKGLGAEKQIRQYLIDEAARQEAQVRDEAAAPAEPGAAPAAARTTAPADAAGVEAAAAAGTEAPATATTEAGVKPAVSGWRLLHRLTGGRPEVAVRLMGYIERTDFTALGIFGLVLLLWTVVNVLSTVEATFNDVWGVTRGRPWLRRFADYTAVLVIAPVLLLAAIGVATYLLSTPIADQGMTATLWRTVVRGIGWLGPAVLVWISFAVFYAFMPYANVGLVPAAVGGVVGGTLWQVAFWGYTTFNVGVASYNAIYTSFAALPIFLAWLYLSWVIVIIGAEVAFAAGHIESYRRSRKDVHLSPTPWRSSPFACSSRLRAPSAQPALPPTRTSRAAPRCLSRPSSRFSPSSRPRTSWPRSPQARSCASSRLTTSPA